MNKSKIIKLAISDILYKYVSGKGVFRYTVKGIRINTEGEMYEVECQECKDHNSCLLLVVQNDDAKTFKYVSMINDDYDDDDYSRRQYYWHNDKERDFYTDIKECRKNEGSNIKNKYKKEIEEIEKNLKYKKDKLTEIENFIKEINEQL